MLEVFDPFARLVPGLGRGRARVLAFALAREPEERRSGGAVGGRGRLRAGLRVGLRVGRGGGQMAETTKLLTLIPFPW